MAAELKDKEVCANCNSLYIEDTKCGYSHLEPYRCKEKNGEECSDIWKTTCIKFTSFHNSKE